MQMMAITRKTSCISGAILHRTRIAERFENVWSNGGRPLPPDTKVQCCKMEINFAFEGFSHAATSMESFLGRMERHT